jgi:hypothetical protein
VSAKWPFYSYPVRISPDICFKDQYMFQIFH